MLSHHLFLTFNLPSFSLKPETLGSTCTIDEHHRRPPHHDGAACSSHVNHLQSRCHDHLINPKPSTLPASASTHVFTSPSRCHQAHEDAKQIATIGAKRSHLHFEPKSHTTKFVKQIGTLNHRESSQNAVTIIAALKRETAAHISNAPGPCLDHQQVRSTPPRETLLTLQSLPRRQP